jgi:hypothetical protein
MAKIGYKKGINELKFNDYINRDRFTYAILEKTDELIFDKLKKIDINNFSICKKGRLFGKETELKWQKRQNGLHIVIITDEPDIPSWVDDYPCNLEPIPQTRSIYLWGEHLKDKDNEWYEKQIPKILEYPIDHQDSKNRVKLKVQEYKLKRKSEDDEPVSIIHRFVGIEEDKT